MVTDMTITFKMPNSTVEELMPVLDHYTVYDFMQEPMHGLAILLYAKNEETGKFDVEYPMITKSFGEFIGYKNTAYIDLNNCPFAKCLLEQGHAEYTGFVKKSGFCTYPLWKFKEEFLNEIGEEKYRIYSQEYDRYMKEAFGNNTDDESDEKLGE